MYFICCINYPFYFQFGFNFYQTLYLAIDDVQSTWDRTETLGMQTLAVYKKIRDAWERVKVLNLVRNQCCTKGFVPFFMKALLAIKLLSVTPFPLGYEFVRYKRFISKDSTEGVPHTEEL